MPATATRMICKIPPCAGAVVQFTATRTMQNEMSVAFFARRSHAPVALSRRCPQDSVAVDAGRKGITGDLFAALTNPAQSEGAKPPPAVRAQPPAAAKSPAIVPGKSPRTPRAKPRPIVLAQPQATPARPASEPSRVSRTAAPIRKLPAFFYRMPLRAQRGYLASDAIDRFPLTPSPAAFTMVTALRTALDGGAPSVVQRASQSLLSEVCRLLGVRPVRIEVRSVRPHNSRGELHGLFYPQAPVRTAAAGEPLIVLWMRTAQRHDVVKPRTYLRTLMHELGHYLDYALLKLDDSYHSMGFYQRESFLVRTLFPGDSPSPRAK